MKTAREILISQFCKGEYDELMHNCGVDITPSILKAMKQYANQKLDEAAEKANLIGDFWGKECDECKFFDTEHGIRMSVNKKSILQLKDL